MFYVDIYIYIYRYMCIYTYVYISVIAIEPWSIYYDIDEHADIANTKTYINLPKQIENETIIEFIHMLLYISNKNKNVLTCIMIVFSERRNL